MYTCICIYINERGRVGEIASHLGIFRGINLEIKPCHSSRLPHCANPFCTFPLAFAPRRGLFKLQKIADVLYIYIFLFFFFLGQSGSRWLELKPNIKCLRGTSGCLNFLIKYKTYCEKWWRRWMYGGDQEGGGGVRRSSARLSRNG